MIVKKQIIRGRMGRTVCYSMPNFRFDRSDNKIKWDAFRFYTPLGNIADSEGTRFFNVMGGAIPVHRDRWVNKQLFVKITRNRGIETFQVPGYAKINSRAATLEGDIVVTIFIPTDPGEEITVLYKEVTDG